MSGFGLKLEDLKGSTCALCGDLAACLLGLPKAYLDGPKTNSKQSVAAWGLLAALLACTIQPQRSELRKAKRLGEEKRRRTLEFCLSPRDMPELPPALGKQLQYSLLSFVTSLFVGCILIFLCRCPSATVLLQADAALDDEPVPCLGLVWSACTY